MQGVNKRHAIWAVLGMITGAAIFAELYPFFKQSVLTWADWGKVSLADVTGLNHWILIILLSTVYIGLFVFLEKKKI